MYLWVVIAIFISALAALNSSLRPDAKEMYINTQAETEITQLYTLHRAALKYVGDHPEKEGQITVSGENANLTAYLPYGFNAGNFVSMSYCVDDEGLLPPTCGVEEDTQGETEVEGEGEIEGGEVEGGEIEGEGEGESNGPDFVSNGSCCAQQGVTQYVITYGALQPRWTNLHTGKPKSEILEAMKSKVGYVDGLGYSVSKDLDDPVMGTTVDQDDPVFTNAELGVASQGTISYTPIPQYITTSNPAFNTGGICSGNGNYCLVYISKISH